MFPGLTFDGLRIRTQLLDILLKLAGDETNPLQTITIAFHPAFEQGETD